MEKVKSLTLIPEETEKATMLDIISSLDSLINDFDGAYADIFIKEKNGYIHQVTDEQTKILEMAADILEEWFAE